VAAELDDSAARTLRRSGYATASVALQRAAELSVSDGDRARRLVAAADAAWRGGHTARAASLLDTAERLGGLAPQAQLDLYQLRGSIETRTGSPEEGSKLLKTAAVEAAQLDPSLAVPLLAAACCATYHAGDRQGLSDLMAICASLPQPTEPSCALLLRMLSQAGQANAASASEPAAHSDLRPGELDDPVHLIYAGELADGFGHFELARRLQRRATARARALGAAGTLAWALENLTLEELSCGHLALAEAYAQEGRRLAAEAGYRNSACRHLAHLAMVAAVRGREEETASLAEQVLAEATARQLAREAATAHAALGLLALGAGRAREALDWLERIWSPGAVPRHDGVATAMVPELVEAAVRAGEPERCRGPLDTYLAWASQSRSASALAARCLALLATGNEAESHFVAALRLHHDIQRPLDWARTTLLYGEFLRRGRRRLDARPHLRAAHEAFERLGLTAWAERASGELRASGEQARKRDPSTLNMLTPQETQIVQAVAKGGTNRDVAAQLFLSPHTVAYHLRNIFTKLEISSRSQLIQLAHASAAPRRTKP
jgi:DNA-binding CsgD family transcriptional regulator